MVADIGAQVADGLAAAHAAGHHAPRRQAGQRAGPRGRSRQDQRLRHRPHCRRPHLDPVGARHRHPVVLLARAGPRRRARTRRPTCGPSAPPCTPRSRAGPRTARSRTRSPCCTRSPPSPLRAPKRADFLEPVLQPHARPRPGLTLVDGRRRPRAAPARARALAREHPRRRPSLLRRSHRAHAGPEPSRGGRSRPQPRHRPRARPQRRRRGRREPARERSRPALGAAARAYAAVIAARAAAGRSAGLGWVLTAGRSTVGERRVGAPRRQTSRPLPGAGLGRAVPQKSGVDRSDLVVRHLAGRRGPGSKAAFVRSYFATAPGGTDEGWSQLGPGRRRRVARRTTGSGATSSPSTVSSVRPVERQRLRRRHADLPTPERADVDRAQAVRPDQVERRRLPHQRRAPDRLTRPPRVRHAQLAVADRAPRRRRRGPCARPACRPGAAAASVDSAG